MGFLCWRCLLHQRPPANSRCGTYGTRGTLTIGFVTVGGFNANQDVLVQQVLGVGDNGLQLQREVHGIRGDELGIGRGGRPPRGGDAGENRPIDVVIKQI